MKFFHMGVAVRKPGGPIESYYYIGSAGLQQLNHRESERHAGRDVDKLRPIRPEFFTADAIARICSVVNRMKPRACGVEIHSAPTQ